MKEVFGMVAEPLGNTADTLWCVFPATKDEEGRVTCHNISGFGGSHEMKSDGVFFPEEGGGCFCQKAMDKDRKYCNIKNEEVK